MKKVAILLTVYNRKAITIAGLSTLCEAIRNVPCEYCFDIYMTNDGGTDGTEIDVHRLYPNIVIIKGKGNLFWSKGMNLAWKTAFKTNDYDYYIWFNDDAMLNRNAINHLLMAINELGDNVVVTGAFKDKDNFVSYGGRNKDNIILTPNGKYQDVHLMNGNLVIIPAEVFKKNGFIDSHYHHGLGDWDYGLRALKNGFKVVLTKEYVGITDRHDRIIPHYLDIKINLVKRIKYLYSPIYSINCKTFYVKRHNGFLKACKIYLLTHIYTLFPQLYK